MDRSELASALVASARSLERPRPLPTRKAEAEGGCGVIGAACSIPLPGRALLQPLVQMRNRGNGKGGGIAAAGLDAAFFNVRPQVLGRDYLLAVAYPDGSARRPVEADFIERAFDVDHVHALAPAGAPEVRCYFVRVRPDVRVKFMREHRLPEEHAEAAEDELVYQSSYRLNRTFYAAAGEKRAFVLSHAKNLLVLKLVGYGDDVIRAYRLQELRAHVWIGHHRYPTKGKVWHPGGAHPFIGLHEALVHNGDFANYSSICAYLAQRHRYPLFLTDTEVAVLAFDLLHRVYGYPLEWVIEAMAPTTERDLALLPPEKQRIARMLQAVHIHGSPDGPWFFLLAQSAPGEHAFRLIGITDTSMLRPQVFALQEGEVAIGFAASEKQAIDAALESLSREDPRFWSRADLNWAARGGSHTDGGAFVFTVRPGELVCTDKFGRRIRPDPAKRPPAGQSTRDLPGYAELRTRLASLAREAGDDEGRSCALAELTRLLDRRCRTGPMKRSCILSLADDFLARIVDGIRRRPSGRYAFDEPDPEATVVVDARGYRSEGKDSLARRLVELVEGGARRLLVANVRGQRFVGCGLGPASHGVRIDVYGSCGDYLASGIDGAEVVVHGTAQDQVAQILKDGRLVVYGDVGQTFMYAAKGGEVFVLGSAAGRPLINAVGRPRVVINGTCLDHLAESFMAGDPLLGGGFAVLNGVAFDEDGTLHDLAAPYPGGNLFSLASGGAIYVRDPRGTLSDDQLNGGEFAPLAPEDWQLLRPYLDENERPFGITVERLLGRQPPARVYRKIRPAVHEALSPEEAWVKRVA